MTANPLPGSVDEEFPGSVGMDPPAELGEPAREPLWGIETLDDAELASVV